MVQIEKVAGSNDKNSKEACPNCNTDITMAHIKALCEVDESGLQEAIDFLNSQRSFFRLTTCTRKAHFLAQLAAESKFSSMEEGFTYNWESLKKTFGNFNTAYDSNNAKAKEWGYGYDGKTKAQVTATDKQSIANWAYGKNPKASGLGNTAITSNWSNTDADGWKYRGSGFIQLTGKSNFRKVTNKYNTWIARLNEAIAEEDFKANPEKLRTNKILAMAAALIYWKDKNILTRSDMGVGDDALKAVTYRINDAFKGYAHRESYLEEAVKTLKVADCPDYKHRKGQKGTVVVIGGKGEKIIQTYGKTDNVMYRLSVYRAMTLEKYNELKGSDELPKADYSTYVTRDAHQGLSNSGRSSLRYGKYNETPPSDNYYLNRSGGCGGSGRGYLMFLSDNPNDKKIKGSDEKRADIAIHQHDKNGSVGCLTLASGSGSKGTGTLGTIPVKELYNEIPDLFLHEVMKDAERTDNNKVVHDMSIDRRPVRLILEEREVTEKTNNNKPYWEGFVDDEYKV
ncbi:hypothetical protein TFHFJT_750002 [Tenacibaculum finnmarkense]|nr:hypothetical protein TFHFJT_750002 [Tenacibaculum finnmarkense]